jgi:hypothetical protein
MSSSNRLVTRTSVPLVLFVTAVVLVAGSGASCPNVIRGYQVGVMPLPRTLPAQPTREQIIAAVEDNTSRVRSYAATQAVLVVPGVPRLSAQVACEPPRRFRLRAQTSLTGNELDIGSNDDLFWLWIRRHEPPIMLFCQHDKYEQSSARQVLPIRADWMPELLGLVRFSPQHRHEGPFMTADGRLEIRSTIDSSDEQLVRSIILHPMTGLVEEQHLFTSTGKRLASVRASRHRVDPGSGAALPRLIDVSWPGSGVEFTLEVTSLVTNVPSTDPGQLWHMPAYDGYEPINLADPSVVIAPAVASPGQ